MNKRTKVVFALAVGAVAGGTIVGISELADRSDAVDVQPLKSIGTLAPKEPQAPAVTQGAYQPHPPSKLVILGLDCPDEDACEIDYRNHGWYIRTITGTNTDNTDNTWVRVTK